jgi:UDP-glucose 4-epimerase
MKNKKVVVTGGAGFIGSNLARELSSDNFVTVIDDLSCDTLGNITDLVDKKKVWFLNGSILNLDLLREVFCDIDFVFHEAAITGIQRSIEDPVTTNEVNITGTLNVLMAAKENKVNKVVFASSSSVYGDTSTMPLSETMIPNPISPYALTKLAGEYYCQLFQQLYGLPTVSLRYFNVYGPGQDLNPDNLTVIPDFILTVSQNKPPIMYGDGNQTRDFAFVADVVQANIIAATSNATGVLNVGTGRETSINDLGEAIIRSMGKDLKPEYVESKTGDIKNSVADISKIRTLGYKSAYSLEEGLRKVISKFF